MSPGAAGRAARFAYDDVVRLPERSEPRRAARGRAVARGRHDLTTLSLRFIDGLWYYLYIIGSAREH